MKQKIKLLAFRSVLFSLLYLPWVSGAQPVDVSVFSTNRDLFQNKKILILGGTGYLGRAITVELLKYNPLSIAVFSRDEVKHFNFTTKTFHNNSKLKNIMGDIRDYDSLLKATKDIDIVFHAAALKRMDALEENVEESIKTNILGSINLFNACVTNKVKKVLFISTDKACSPINTYGACKFVSEKIFTNYDKTKFKTQFVVVRFGNILDSTGSVIPVFIDKLKNDHCIPLTDDRMTRFIIDKTEAVALIFDALRYGHGGEIFIKKLPAMKIIDLIEVLKKMLVANNEVKIVGLRPGEKIHELLINETEIPRTIEFNGYYIIQPSVQCPVDNNNELPIYAKRGIHLKRYDIKEFSSSDTLISTEDMEKLLTNLAII